MTSSNIPLRQLLDEVRACQHCADLPLGPNPVVQLSSSAKLLIVGQAPGTKVHNTGIPWNDPSGDNLREWMGITREQFYDEQQVAIMPMGFCYPGKGRSGDLPPRPECAPHWHQRLRDQLPNIELTLLVGQYAQRYYLPEDGHQTLTDRVSHWQEYLTSGFLPLVHPSPRNRLWLKRNPWFLEELVPELQHNIKRVLDFNTVK
ncbi:uracil-DNA glycosylase family protein [Porticoccaceae bacterium LTM1]|nr:uracil-DNA glycosylase family protein [Porticoccaceae bacterium LTM1]